MPGIDADATGAFFEGTLTLETVSSVLDDALGSISGSALFPCGGTSRITEGERRRAAVLFVDLTGFTLLSESMDHEELHALLGRIMGILSTVVTSYGGYVDKFEGDRLMALFGAMFSTENDSVRAVGCALKMLELLEDVREALRSMPLVSARIGIDFGPLTVAPDPSGHVTATGLTVNLASRLEQAAPPGTALVSSAVHRECGELYSWHELGPIQVRGITAEVEVFRPLGPGKIRQERWQRAAKLAGSPFVGRSDDIERIRNLLLRPGEKTDETALVMIAGDAGIGKSRLAHRCIEEVSGFRVLRGQALSHAQPSCWLWISLLRNYFDSGEGADHSRNWYLDGIARLASECSEERTRTALENYASSLSGILSLDAPGLKSGASAGVPALANAIRSALEAVFSRERTLLLLEDLHWVDEVSLSVLRLVLGQGMLVQPGGIIMTTRLPAPMLGNTQCPLQTIELSPLSDPDSMTVAAHLLSLEAPEQVDAGLAGLVLRVGRGNPFVVEELVLSLMESGGLIEDDRGRWSLSIPCENVQIPSSISVLTQARMDRLPRAERRMLQFASVLGERFSLELLEAVLRDLSIDVEEPGKTLQSLVEKGFLAGSEDRAYLFRHALVRMAAYETLLKHNARLLHRSTAAAMEKLYPTELDALAPVILSHWEGAEDRENSFRWALRAMLIARDGGRPEEALKLAERLLELTGAALEETLWQGRMQALLVRQEMVERGGAHEEAVRLADLMYLEAHGRNSLEWEAASLRARAKVLQELGRNTDFETTIRQALDAAVGSGNEVLEAKVKMTLANYRSSVGLAGGAMELYTEASEALERNGMGAETASLLSNMAVHAFRQGDDELSAKFAEMAVKTHSRHGNLQGLGYSLNSLAIACARRECYDRAEELFLEALEASRKTGDRVHECTLLGNLGLLARKRGDIRKAMAYTDESIDLATRFRNYRTIATSLVNRANILRMERDWEGALASAMRSLEVNELAGDVLNVAYAKGVLGLVYLESGESAEAFRVCGELGRYVEAHSIRLEILDDYRQLLDDLEARGFPVVRPSRPSS